MPRRAAELLLADRLGLGHAQRDALGQMLHLASLYRRVDHLERVAVRVREHCRRYTGEHAVLALVPSAAAGRAPDEQQLVVPWLCARARRVRVTRASRARRTRGARVRAHLHYGRATRERPERGHGHALHAPTIQQRRRDGKLRAHKGVILVSQRCAKLESPEVIHLCTRDVRVHPNRTRRTLTHGDNSNTPRVPAHDPPAFGGYFEHGRAR